MSDHKSRLARIEKALRPSHKQAYVCTYYEGSEAEGFTVFDGRREGMHFATRAELDAFAARPDVDLTRIVIVYADDKPTSTITQGNYKTRVGIDMGEL